MQQNYNQLEDIRTKQGNLFWRKSKIFFFKYQNVIQMSSNARMGEKSILVGRAPIRKGTNPGRGWLTSHKQQAP